MNRSSILSALALLWLGLAPVAAQRVLFVATNASGAGNGGSWTDAYVDLQPALVAAVSGDEIWVRAGAYYPGAAGNRTATFGLKNGVRLCGGFAGDETIRDQRDPQRNETILSGDLSRNDQPNFVNYTENSYHVVSAGSGTDATAVLDGFVIQAGNASGSTSANNSGAGLKIDRGTPTIANCVFRANLGRIAGALLNLNARPVVTNCVFTNNVAQSTFARGGAAYLTAGSAPLFADCLFVTNRALGGVSAIDGGAVFIEAGSPAAFLQCTFVGNRSATAEPNTASGGAVSSFSGGVAFQQCAFWNNSSGAGGAVWTGGTNFSFVNCAFGGNVAASGGALMNFSSTGALAGCTLAGNFANEGGGLLNDLNSQAQIRNCILWTNIATNATTTLKAQVRNLNGASNTVAFSCVQGLFVQQPGEPPPSLALFPGSTDADPRLTDVAQRKLHLRLGSPCLDAGDNSAIPIGATTDLDHGARFVNETLTADTGSGAPPLADMGAYEYQGVVPEQISEPVAGRELIGGVEHFTVTYRRDRSLANVTVSAESTPEIFPAQWAASGLEFNQVAEDPTHKTFKAKTPLGVAPGRFFRLKVTRP